MNLRLADGIKVGSKWFRPMRASRHFSGRLFPDEKATTSAQIREARSQSPSVLGPTPLFARETRRAVNLSVLALAGRLPDVVWTSSAGPGALCLILQTLHAKRWTLPSFLSTPHSPPGTPLAALHTLLSTLSDPRSHPGTPRSPAFTAWADARGLHSRACVASCSCADAIIG